jgi:hypothetical protein
MGVPIEQHFYEKLLKAYKDHNNVIIAFDFDGTVYDHDHNDLGYYTEIANILRECEDIGFQLLCYTANDGERLTFIEFYLKEVCRLKSVRFMDNSMKPYANIYLDDKGGLMQAAERLRKLLNTISQAKQTHA